MSNKHPFGKMKPLKVSNSNKNLLKTALVVGGTLLLVNALRK